MSPSSTDPSTAALQARVNRVHLRSRLGLEDAREARVLGQGRGLLHIENWVALHKVIRCAVTMLGLYGRGRRNARRIGLRENVLTLPHLPAVFDGFSVLHISDPHFDIATDMPGVIAERVAGVACDIAVVTGDFRAATSGPWQAAVDGMRSVSTVLRAPTYAVLGNHDSLRMVPSLEALGVRVLLNEALPIERNGERIWLAGVDDPHYYRTDNLERACDAIAEDEISLLLAHSPEIYRQATHAGFDLMLCGHTHGGQICLPGGVPVLTNADCPRQYCVGAWRYHGMHGYTSRGTGVSMVDVRLNCPPEVTLHRLRRG